MTPEETLATPPPVYLMPTVNPMANKVKILGIFFAIFAAFYLAIFFYMMFVMGVSDAAIAHQAAPAGSRASQQSMGQMAGVFVLFAGIFGGFFAVCGALNLAAAIGLLAKKSWGRTLAIIAAIPMLINVPFGTALGIFTLVAMLQASAKENYARLCAGS